MSTINLLPDDYLKRRAQRRANVMCLVLFVVVMAGVGGAALVSEQSYEHTRTVSRRVDAAYEDAARMIQRMQELERRKGRMLSKAKRTAALMEKVPRSYIIGAITHALPKGASLLKVKMDTRVIAEAGRSGRRRRRKHPARNVQTQTEVELRVEGLAWTDVHVARFIANLARDPLIAAVDLIYSEQTEIDDETTTRKFEIRLEMKKGADAVEAVALCEEARNGRLSRAADVREEQVQ